VKSWQLPPASIQLHGSLAGHPPGALQRGADVAYVVLSILNLIEVHMALL